MLPFKVSFKTGTPVYEQVLYAVRKALVTGLLTPGDAFPSVRTLSQELKINPNTAFKIVGVLKQEGILEVVPGIGTLVSADYQPPAQDRTALLEGTLESLAVTAKQLGLSQEDVLQAFTEHWNRLQ